MAITPAVVCDSSDPEINALALQEQAPRYRLDTMLSMVKYMRYSTMLEGGVFGATEGKSRRTLITNPTSLGYSVTTPEAVDYFSGCLNVGPGATFGQTEYSATLQLLDGQSPPICVQALFPVVANSASQAGEAMRLAIRELMEAQNRSNIRDLSGIKAVVRADLPVPSSITGGIRQVSAPWPNFGLPDGTLTFNWLLGLSNFMNENLDLEKFSGGEAGEYYTLIAEQAAIDSIRNELNLAADIRALTAGSFRFGERQIRGYTFDGPYRGWGYGVDPKPLRFNTVQANGTPNWIEPYLEIGSDVGTDRVPNPEWTNANYSCGFAFSKRTFRRLVPANFLGDKDIRFPAQYAMGELVFQVIKDRLCNPRGRFGNYYYSVVAGYEPIRPHGVIPILFKRCVAQTGVVSCSSTYYNGTTYALS